MGEWVFQFITIFALIGEIFIGFVEDIEEKLEILRITKDSSVQYLFNAELIVIIKEDDVFSR